MLSLAVASISFYNFFTAPPLPSPPSPPLPSPPSPPTCDGGRIWAQCGTCDRDCNTEMPMVCQTSCIPKCQCPIDKPVFQNGKCVEEGECLAYSLGFKNRLSMIATLSGANAGAVVAIGSNLLFPGVSAALSFAGAGVSIAAGGYAAYTANNHDNWGDDDAEIFAAIKSGAFSGTLMAVQSEMAIASLADFRGALYAFYSAATPEEREIARDEMCRKFAVLRDYAVVTEIANMFRMCVV